ncbi:Mannose-6-phosphate isomerase, cupin superfamily [Nostoc flagelliforme CCNUN1]|uniref:Mannose-6-phosphate isomerase, cupin superfamily n=1 Tax=Nostoc flagelliforme CCNUN1 TaxID=2038116 RepID=A0A2K8SHE5_9NOSO|nr:Mannose-6-phosphate isomerase, cupin superfamily [Nostoc flagelliforme CCNUN1]
MITTSLKDLAEESVSHNAEIKKKVMLRFGDLPHLTNLSSG